MHIAGFLRARFADNTLYAAVASFDMVTHRVTYYNMPSRPIVHAELAVELNGHHLTFDFDHRTGKLTPPARLKLLSALHAAIQAHIQDSPA